MKCDAYFMKKYSNQSLYLENGVIKAPAVEQAMLQVDRGNFVQNSAYSDTPISIGYGATISAPHMVRAYLRDSLSYCTLEIREAELIP